MPCRSALGVTGNELQPKRRLLWRVFLGAIVAGCLAAILLRITPASSDRATYPAEFAEADRLIAEVERFRGAHGRLPNDMAELGFRSSKEVDYHLRKGGEEYWVTVPAPTYGFFGTLKYNSTSRHWYPTD